MNTGWVKIDRGIINHESLDTLQKLVIFFTAIVKANYEPNIHKGIKLEKGQFSTSYDRFAMECRLAKSTLKDNLKKLQKDKMIRVKSYSQCTVITVVNYERWQTNRPETDQEPPADRPQTERKSVTNKKKEIRNKKQEVYITDFFPDPELNKWVGHVTPGILKKWQRFDPNDLQKIAYEAKGWQAQHGKKYTNIASFLNRWFNRNNFYKELEAEWELCQKYGY